MRVSQNNATHLKMEVRAPRRGCLGRKQSFGELPLPRGEPAAERGGAAPRPAMSRQGSFVGARPLSRQGSFMGVRPLSRQGSFSGAGLPGFAPKGGEPPTLSKMGALASEVRGLADRVGAAERRAEARLERLEATLGAVHAKLVGDEKGRGFWAGLAPAAKAGAPDGAPLEA